MNAENCPKCDGSNPGCPQCDGLGVIIEDGESMFECEACDGTGHNDNSEIEDICQYCDGTGLMQL